MKERVQKQGRQEEFSIEFGDVNGIKLYELFAMSRGEELKKDKDEPEKGKK
ncbi:hypothetical protein [Neobacillus sp. YIM B06451]|uniref:hypothetical protein n=1 Tax=Neobacillus sp. YIM B06451 TaxID=3070994 RepID=UPI00292E0CFA|nr:hypothetical protein [Neobacillus sp. YIM B06451]